MQITIYATEEDREMMRQLLVRLRRQGAPVQGPHGPSLSAMIRYLVEQELERQAAQE